MHVTNECLTVLTSPDQNVVNWMKRSSIFLNVKAFLIIKSFQTNKKVLSKIWRKLEKIFVEIRLSFEQTKKLSLRMFSA